MNYQYVNGHTNNTDNALSREWVCPNQKHREAHKAPMYSHATTKNGNFKNQKETQGKLCVCLLLIYNIKNDGKCDFLTFLLVFNWNKETVDFLDENE